MKKHANIPIFIPHLGCPNQCVFCNQRTISGVTEFDISTVDDQISRALSTVDDGRECEIAFFGGSFTGIDRDLMINLLEIAYKYVKSDRVASIRCSTRPDYINEDILNILGRYSVKTIELGLQSSSDKVLLATKRGHTFSDEQRAVKLIKEYGFDLVGQMMIGLPCSTLDDELATARFIVESGATAARIYPTVVFRDTELYGMSLSGIYSPISVDEAIDRSSSVLDVFIKSGVQVIRIGLCAQDNIFDKSTFFAGANHPALGELIIGEWYFKNIIDKLKQTNDLSGKSIKITVPCGATSKARGQKNKNVERLISSYGLSSVSFLESEELLEFELIVDIDS